MGEEGWIPVPRNARGVLRRGHLWALIVMVEVSPFESGLGLCPGQQRGQESQGVFPDGSDSKESACNSGELGLIPGLGRFPGEGMIIHSSIPAWIIPWTEEPGRLQSIKLQRIGHDCMTNAFTF